MNTFKDASWGCALIFSAIVIIYMLITILVYTSWNIIAPFFHVPPISWITAFGITLLLTLIKWIFTRSNG